MTQKEKELLVQDLCARLPYGVKGKVETTDGNGQEITDEGVLNSVFIDEYGKEYICIDGAEYELEDFKPYLRPMSSMTEDEAKQIIKFICEDSISINKIEVKQDCINANVDYLIGDSETITVWFDNIIRSIEIFDFLNARYFDYRGLIKEGLDIEAPNDMYDFKP